MVLLSVIQRQLWLMANKSMDRAEAYDLTRREFYRMRQEEEVEKRIAMEEARHVGAYFGKSRLEVGMLLEDREYENWKVWAGKQAANREAAERAQLDTYGNEEAEGETNDAVEGPPAAEEAAAPAVGR